MKSTQQLWADELAGSRLQGQRWVRARRRPLPALPFLIFGLAFVGLAAFAATHWSHP